MRSPLSPYPDEASARVGGPTPWQLSLDGAWRFRLLSRPEDVTAEHLTGDDSLWDTVTVPGNWTMQGYDRPHYTNVQMPFDGPPPRVPDLNPTGVYRTTIRLPRTSRRRRVVLHVGAAESVLYVYVNGRFAGSSTDSRLECELDITALVQPGANELACVVVRWSAHSYMEDQDHWWMAGIHRSTYLVSTEPVYLADVRVDAGLADDLT